MSDTPLTPDQLPPLVRAPRTNEWTGPSADELVVLGNLCVEAARRWGMDAFGEPTTGRMTTPEWAIACHQAAAAYFQAAIAVYQTFPPDVMIP